MKTNCISHKYKCILIRIPKTATTSIIKGLDMNSSYNDHVDWKESYERNKNFLHYTKFAIVRNPWDRFVSFYHYCKSPINYHHDNTSKNIKRHHEFYNLFKNKTFKEIVFLFYNNKQNPKWFDPQYKFIYDNMNIKIDLLLKFENLKEDIKKIDKNITLFKINTTNHLPYRTYYDEETKFMIGELYKKDIELFNYQF